MNKNLQYIVLSALVAGFLSVPTMASDSLDTPDGALLSPVLTFGVPMMISAIPVLPIILPGAFSVDASDLQLSVDDMTIQKDQYVFGNIQD